MIRAGVAGFKCFLIHSGVDEFPHVADCDLHAAMKQLEGTGSVLLVNSTQIAHTYKKNPNNNEITFFDPSFTLRGMLTRRQRRQEVRMF